jgi:hypothetical protein
MCMKSLCTRYMLLLLLALTTLLVSVSAQKINGVVKDMQSDEPIPFASAVLKNAKSGALTDSLGKFSIVVYQSITNDTLQIFSVGYKSANIPLTHFKDSVFIEIKLEVLPPVGEAVVKAKYNRALWFWKQIMKRKAENDKTKWDNYGYEIYNKLELDLNNVNKKKLSKNILLKPLNFVLSFVDSTSEEKPFLPVYLTETLSDFYYQKNPKRVHEFIKAAKTNGIDNESLIKQLGGMYQNINVYNNFIPVFDKQFISPFNSNADKYYQYKLLDTQYLGTKRLIHFRFTPKVKGSDIFEGDAWINDTLFAIQKITLRPAVDANINYLSNLSLIQEFKLINDTTWFLYKDKFVADISPLGSKKISLKGRKTTTYKNVLINNSSISEKLLENKKIEEVEVDVNGINYADSFWKTNRHEALNKNEQTVYKVLDTLTNNPTYISYRNTLTFLSTGVKDIGNIRIGPWFYWFSGNNFEGTRLRFDLSTNTGFNKKLYLHTYLAYGFTDKRFKTQLDARYLFNKKPWTYLHLTYRDDFDNGQQFFDQLGTDNLFATWFRKPGIPFKFQRSEEKKITFFREANSGLSIGLMASSKDFQALANLPDQKYYPTTNGHVFNSFETSIRLKYAYLERFVVENFYRTSLGSSLPIIDFTFTHGWPGVLKSSYQYNKLQVNISNIWNVPPYGKISYNFYAGKIDGTIPYQFLEIMPGNELNYYNRYSFNLMKRFEFLADQYAGFSVEHNVGSGLFRYIPITRKMKLRQLYSLKGVTGNLSKENEQLNFVGTYPFGSLNNKWYFEFGTGIDNIFKLLRLDFVWRVTANDRAKQIQPAKFGVFGSFRIAF